jgi:hypothetical protein
MNYTYRPAVREQTPLIIGIGGPTKSGKTFSAHRLAVGLADGGDVAMLNAEGARGHQYAERFKYVACDLVAPFRPTNYTAALRELKKLKPKVAIIDSVSHMHDGPGGVLEWHDEELTRLAGQDQAKRDKANFTAWVRPKAAVNEFIYEILSMDCAVILCLRAKEKIKIVPGRQPVDLGWQPIVDERVAFETLFTLMLPPHSKGVPDLAISDMREPFDKMVPTGKPIDEELGKQLAAWARGGVREPRTASASQPAQQADDAGRAPAGEVRDPGAPRGAADPSQAAGRDASASLFSPTEPVKAEKVKTPIPGVDVPDERQQLEAAILAEKGKLERQPTEEVWKKICEDVCGTTVLSMADPSALSDLLSVVKGLLAKDREAIARVKKIMGSVAA